MRLSSTGERMPEIRRALAPHWGALLALGLFLAGGLAVMDDYGVAWDEPWQRETAEVNLSHLSGESEGLFGTHQDFYGVAFEMPLFLAERFFGLESIRDVYLSRHLITHLLYLAGGLFAYLLARRLLGNWLVALFAMLVFLLHPRLYAHSFFNSKDLPFFTMFIIALYLTHRAFKTDRVWAFALLGAAVGALTNLLIPGALLFAAIPAMRALDFLFAPGQEERKRVVLTTAVFALTGGLAVYALMPHLWIDPLMHAVEWWKTFSQHPNVVTVLYRGTEHLSKRVPVDYVPLWFSITSPPFALLLGLIGFGAALVGGIKARLGALRNTRKRFAIMLAGCFALPLLAVALLDPNVYNGWRKFYFLWGPFSLLAALGLERLFSVFTRRRLRAVAFAAAGAGAVLTLVSMALIHPNQQASFNFIVDRATPEQLQTQFQMDYSDHQARQAIEWLLDESPTALEDVNLLNSYSAHLLEFNAGILPNRTGERIIKAAASLRLPDATSPGEIDRVAHRVKIYGNTIMTTWRKANLRAVYEAIRLREPDIESVFSVYHLDEGLALLKEPCAPSYLSKTHIAVTAIPVDVNDLPPWRRPVTRGFEVVSASVSGVIYPGATVAMSGAAFDGKCVAFFPLDYPLADFDAEWEPELMGEDEARDAVRRATEEGRLLGRSVYDVYLAEDELVYVNGACDPAGTEHRFFLHIFPERASDLPGERRRYGFDNLNFDFYANGALLDGECVARVPLPEYSIAGIQTGQFMVGEEEIWSVETSLRAESSLDALRAAVSGEPLARSVFDLRLVDGGLVYVKEPCDDADVEPRFFLHVIPERVNDLPEERKEYGFENLDFSFFPNGVMIEGNCLARIQLPEYEIARARTGQLANGRAIWTEEFEVGQFAH